MLVAGCLLLVACCWLLVAGYLLLVAGCLLLVACCWLLVAGCLLLVAGCLLLDYLFMSRIPHTARRTPHAACLIPHTFFISQTEVLSEPCKRHFHWQVTPYAYPVRQLFLPQELLFYLHCARLPAGEQSLRMSAPA